MDFSRDSYSYSYSGMQFNNLKTILKCPHGFWKNTWRSFWRYFGRSPGRFSANILEQISEGIPGQIPVGIRIVLKLLQPLLGKSLQNLFRRYCKDFSMNSYRRSSWVSSRCFNILIRFLKKNVLGFLQNTFGILPRILAKIHLFFSKDFSNNLNINGFLFFQKLFYKFMQKIYTNTPMSWSQIFLVSPRKLLHRFHSRKFIENSQKNP